MDKNKIEYIQLLAQKFENKDFIPKDPISFPHLFQEKKDIEIAAFVAQWLAYGKRELFLKVLEMLSIEMNLQPFDYIANRRFERLSSDNNCLYRFFKRKDFYSLCQSLYNIYIIRAKGEKSFEDVLRENLNMGKNIDTLMVINEIQKLFIDVKGIPNNTKSSCKRLCMFLRWMVRMDSEVDFGIWHIVRPEQLIIPLDVHVFRQSRLLGLTSRNDASMRTAIDITNSLKEIFPTDPTKADFALFGLGVNSTGSSLD